MKPSSDSIRVLLAAAPADGTAPSTPAARSLERRDERFVVETARDPDDAAALRSTDRFDCVVAEGGFADGDGLDLLVDADESREAIPRILAIDATRVGDPSALVTEALAAGVTDVVRCPEGDPTVRLLAHRVANAVESHRAAAEADRQRERLDRFVSGVSHDLRSPLNVAQGRLEMAQDEPAGDHLDTAATAVDRTLELIADLLALARQGETPRELEPVGLRETVEGCWATVATGDATLTVASDARVFADPSRLKQLFENLLGNAVAHGGDGVAVTVGPIRPMYTSTRAEPLPAGFYVADDGAGIPEGERDRVFDVGYTTAAEGTGFGLNIVREVAAAHGWDVGVTESADGGARFEVTGVDVEE
ncbi:sensor histidine kinase [Halorubrum yunnanense]|uniref:histidine kinase n=1 Tax=Halorubrum yunnanense TaxID=1526162 RepID=A0ABD5YCC4_9EURY|nr:ATP-binding protein [Halorubrum yunnanense]